MKFEITFHELNGNEGTELIEGDSMEDVLDYAALFIFKRGATIISVKEIKE